MSVAEILRSSFVEKARLQFPKQLENLQGNENTNCSIQSESFSCSRSLPRTADMSNITLNGGPGISFASATAQGFDESFAPAEMMQSKLLMGEISWAQEFAATVPTAALSKQALEKIAAPQTPEIETSVSKYVKSSFLECFNKLLMFSFGSSVIAGDPNFSLGTYFQTRSENLSVFGMDKVSRTSMQPKDKVPETPLSTAELTPHVENKTYTKVESSANFERNLMKKMHQGKLSKAHQIETKKKPPTSSEMMSLSAIDAALREYIFMNLCNI